MPNSKNNKYVAAAFTGLRPMTVGLIGAAALLLMNKENFIDYKVILTNYYYYFTLLTLRKNK